MRLENLVIPNGAAPSNPITLEPYDSITLIPAGAAFTNVVTLQARADSDDTWVDVGTDGVDVVLTGIQTLTLTKIHGGQIRLLSAANEGAERTVAVFGSGPQSA